MLNKIAITLVKGVGPILTRTLISECGGVDEVFAASDNFLLSIPKVSRRILKSLRDPAIFERAKQEAHFIERNQIRPLFYLDEEFPSRLEFCVDAPLLLYARGDFNLNNRRVISIVGTRSCTSYGRGMCEKIISELVPYNPIIVSGLAIGIDSVAHKVAVECGLQTVGVLAHGVDSVYPPSSRAVAAKMISHGGLISEFLSGTLPIRENFPNRNRIIAGLCDALIVVESKKRGGSIISAELAYGYHKDVFAIPGKATDKLSEGCNNLIKYQKAVMVTSGKDIARELNWSEKKINNPQVELFPKLNPEEKIILDAIASHSQLGIDEIGEKTGFSPSKLAQLLLQLEFNGLVRPLPGKVYQIA